jgi:hypothetical protein
METRTRSGRVSRPPVRYEPVEEVTDDPEEDHDDEEELDSEEDSDEDEDSDDDEDDSDADENGNLKGFVVDSESEEEA